jgi:hypothetical protein
VIIWGPWHFPQPPTLYLADSEQHREKGEGLLLGPDARTRRPSPCACPPSPQAVHIWENPSLRQGKTA